jgi:hypothetical protein
MGINPMNKITIIIRTLFAVTLFQHIRQQGHYVHIFGGKVEIRKDYENMVFMTIMEDGRLMKLKRTSACTHVAYLSHHDASIISSSILWHARFGNINYDSLCLLRKNGVSGLPIIPRK